MNKIQPALVRKMAEARQMTWNRFGKSITFYLPGMFTLDGRTGQYPAATITGSECALQCDHCAGKILETMVQAETPERLLDRCRHLAAAGNRGVLISGGCNPQGQLPWEAFLPVIRRIKSETDLIVSVHAGLVSPETARDLKAAGVDQALVDVIGDDETFRKVYHVDFGVDRIVDTLAALTDAGLPVIPHVVCGLLYGRIQGERRAIDIIAPFCVAQLVFVSLMGIPDTPMFQAPPPAPEAVAELIADARLAMPDTRLSLGCARQRGNDALEIMAIDAGINRLALPSDEAVAHAEALGLTVRYQRTCCSVSEDFSETSW